MAKELSSFKEDVIWAHIFKKEEENHVFAEWMVRQSRSPLSYKPEDPTASSQAPMTTEAAAKKPKLSTSPPQPPPPAAAEQ